VTPRRETRPGIGGRERGVVPLARPDPASGECEREETYPRVVATRRVVAAEVARLVARWSPGRRTRPLRQTRAGRRDPSRDQPRDRSDACGASWPLARPAPGSVGRLRGVVPLARPDPASDGREREGTYPRVVATRRVMAAEVARIVARRSPGRRTRPPRQTRAGRRGPSRDQPRDRSDACGASRPSQDQTRHQTDASGKGRTREWSQHAVWWPPRLHEWSLGGAQGDERGHLGGRERVVMTPRETSPGIRRARAGRHDPSRDQTRHQADANADASASGGSCPSRDPTRPDPTPPGPTRPDPTPPGPTRPGISRPRALPSAGPASPDGPARSSP
jgi:hypothetical protein